MSMREVTEADIGKRVHYPRGIGFLDFQGRVGTLVRVEKRSEDAYDWSPANLWWVVDWDGYGEHRHFKGYLLVEDDTPRTGVAQ